MKTYLSWLLPTTDSSDACTEFLVPEAGFPDQEESQDSGSTTQFISTVEPYSLPGQGRVGVPAQLGPRHSPHQGPYGAPSSLVWLHAWVGRDTQRQVARCIHDRKFLSFLHKDPGKPAGAIIAVCKVQVAVQKRQNEGVVTEGVTLSGHKHCIRQFLELYLPH